MKSSHPFLPGIVLVFSFLAGVALLPTAHAIGPAADVFLGYSRLAADTFYPNVGGLNGWAGALHVKVKNRFLGAEGDISEYGLGADGTVPRTTAFMVGPRATVGALSVRVFVHGLFGGEHSANSSGASISGGSFAYALGGGVDVPIAPFFGWRVAVDHINAPTVSPGDSNHVRLSTGIVFRF
jgi:hypothetical protein